MTLEEWVQKKKQELDEFVVAYEGNLTRRSPDEISGPPGTIYNAMAPTWQARFDDWHKFGW